MIYFKQDDLASLPVCSLQDRAGILVKWGRPETALPKNQPIRFPKLSNPMMKVGKVSKVTPRTM